MHNYCSKNTILYHQKKNKQEILDHLFLIRHQRSPRSGRAPPPWGTLPSSPLPVSIIEEENHIKTQTSNTTSNRTKTDTAPDSTKDLQNQSKGNNPLFIFVLIIKAVVSLASMLWHYFIKMTLSDTLPLCHIRCCAWCLSLWPNPCLNDQLLDTKLPDVWKRYPAWIQEETTRIIESKLLLYSAKHQSNIHFEKETYISCSHALGLRINYWLFLGPIFISDGWS